MENITPYQLMDNVAVMQAKHAVIKQFVLACTIGNFVQIVRVWSIEITIFNAKWRTDDQQQDLSRI